MIFDTYKNIKPLFRHITPAEVVMNCIQAGFPVPVLAMPFWEGVGNKVYDFSGYNNNGTLTLGPIWTSGVSGSALSFDGVNDYVAVADSISIDLTNAGSFSAWIRPSGASQSQYARIFIKGNANTIWSYFIAYDITGQYIRINTYTSASVSSISPTTTYAKQWYHVVGTYDGVTQRLYINGINVASDAQSGTLRNAGNLTIGADVDSPYYPFNGLIDSPMIFNCALTASQVQFLYANPYFMFQPIPVPYGYVAAGGQIYSVTLSDNFSLSDTPKKIKEQQVTEILSTLFDASWKIKEQQIAEPPSVLFDSLGSSIEFPRIFQDNLSNLSEQIYKILNKTSVESILAPCDILMKSLGKKQTESLQTLQDNSRKAESKICPDIIPNLNEQIYKTLNKIFIESIPVLSDTFQTQVAGIIVKLLTDNFLLSDQLTKLLEKKQTEFLQTPQDALETERFFYQKLLDTLQTLQDNSRKAESKTSADIFTNIQDQSNKVLLLSALDNINVLDVFRKEEFKFFIESVVLSDTLTKQIAKLLSEQLNISDAYSIEVAAQIIEKLLTDSIRLSDLYKLNQNKSITDSFANLSDTFAAEIVKLSAIVLYMLTDIKDLIGRDTDIKDLIGRDTDIKGH